MLFERSSAMKTSTTESPSASRQPMDASRAETTESAWKPLYRVGGAAALMVVLLYVIQIVVLERVQKDEKQPIENRRRRMKPV
jgi:hypothetical protein